MSILLMTTASSLPGQGLFRQVAQITASSSSIAEHLSAPPRRRLGDLRLSDAVRGALEAPLAHLGLTLESYEGTIPDFYRTLSVDRAGGNCFAEIPRVFLETFDEDNLHQLLLLEGTLGPEFEHLIVFTDAPSIHSAYTKGIWRRWQQKHIFDLVEHYDAGELEDFKSQDESTKVGWLKNVLKLENGGGETGTVVTAIGGLLDGQQIGELMAIVAPLFNPASFTIFLQHRLLKNLHDLVRPDVNFRVAVNDVITTAVQEGWFRKLLTDLLRERPTAVDLVAFAARLDIAPPPPDSAEDQERGRP